MSWFGLGKTRKRHLFDDDDRESSKEIRTLNQEMARMQMEIQRARIERQQILEEERTKSLLEELRGGGEEEGSDMKEQALMLLLRQLQAPQAAPIQQPVQQLISYSDEQLMDMFDKLPKLQRNLLKTLPETVFVAKAREMYNADDDSIKRAWALVHD